MKNQKKSIASTLWFVFVMSIGSFAASLIAAAAGHFLHLLLPVSLFEGTIIFLAVALIGALTTGLMSIYDCMNTRFEDWE